MKEEPPRKKLPPKKASGNGYNGNGGNPTTPSKTTNDEILSTLLRINNFDSISSIKDESLDIDLTACVTISPVVFPNGNSFSSTDFWRVLDESAQNPQMDLTMSSDDGSVGLLTDSPTLESHRICGSSSPISPINNDQISIKREMQQQPSSFSGTFLRPEPPSAMSFSPLKKQQQQIQIQIKSPLPAEHPHQQQHRQRKTKLIQATLPALMEKKKPKVSYTIKEEPPEQLLADSGDDTSNSTTASSTCESISLSKTTISAPNFSLFMLPTTTTTNTTADTTDTTKTDNNERENVDGLSDTKTTSSRMSTTTTTSADSQSSGPENNTTMPLMSAEPLYKCLDCDGLILHGIQEFSTHEMAAHRILYKCGTCNREFDQESGLKKHVKTHRPTEARKDVWKKCPDCGKCLKLGSMWMHRKIHSDNKKYGCDICGQKFVQKINLTHHSRVHTAEKPYECPECQKRFQERSHLQRHQKYHAQTRSYRCEKCGKMYKTERCLKVHNLVHLEQRPFACNVCDKSFISNSKLKQHSNIHTGERPFKCNYCPRDFTNFPNWLKHTRRRHKVDHKTGEQLENIPSYCSKKSTKVNKATTAASTTANVTPTSNVGAITSKDSNTNVGISSSSNTMIQATYTTTKVSAATMSATTATAVNGAIKTSVNSNATTVIAAPIAKAPVKRTKKKTTAVTTITKQQQQQQQQLHTQIAATTDTTTTVTKKLLTNDNVPPPLVSIGAPIATNITTTKNSKPIVVAGGGGGASLTIVPVVVPPLAIMTKPPKTKRERKQLTPKQVQKMPTTASPQHHHMQQAQTTSSPSQLHTNQTQLSQHPLAAHQSTSAAVKKEFQEPKPFAGAAINEQQQQKQSVNNANTNNFPDLHCLSLTSAEELIMEQALEMEECGLYDATSAVRVADTDNAISSSEAATALHFKIKNEFLVDDIKEEFITIKDANNHRVICSSLESSPYSSPASIELPALPNCVTTTAAGSKTTTTATYFLPNNFSLGPQNTNATTTLVTSLNPSQCTNLNGNTDIVPPPLAPLQQSQIRIVQQQTLQQHQQQQQRMQTTNNNVADHQQQQQHHQNHHNHQHHHQSTTTTQALLNQLYFPMPLLVQPNQVLPSVDTLLFTAAAAAASASAASKNTNPRNFYRGKSASQSSTTSSANLT